MSEERDKELIREFGLCESCKKNPIMYLIIETFPVHKEHYRTRKLCANCVILNCGDAVNLRELFPKDI